MLLILFQGNARIQEFESICRYEGRIKMKRKNMRERITLYSQDLDLRSMGFPIDG